MTDVWAWWRAAVDAPKSIGKELIVTTTPEWGFYKARYPDSPWEPVAIWQTEIDADGNPTDRSEWRAWRGTQAEGKMVDAHDVWTFCCRQPVTQAVYEAVAERGEPWPEDDPTVAASFAPAKPGEPPLDPVADMRKRINLAIEGAKLYDNGVPDQETAGKAQSLRDMLNGLKSEADKTRKAEKQPHWDAGVAVDNKWKPLIDLAGDAAKGLTKKLDDFATAQLRAQREAERKAAAAAPPVKQTVTEMVQSFEDGGFNPPAPPIETMPAQIKGSFGKAASVKAVNVVTEITDQDALYRFLRDSKELVDLMFKLAQKCVDVGQTPPGVKIEEKAKVK